MTKLTVVLNIWEAFTAFSEAHDKATWIEKNPARFKIINTIWKLSIESRG